MFQQLAEPQSIPTPTPNECFDFVAQGFGLAMEVLKISETHAQVPNPWSGRWIISGRGIVWMDLTMSSTRPLIWQNKPRIAKTKDFDLQPPKPR